MFIWRRAISNRFTRQRQDLGLEYYVNSFYSFPVTIYMTQPSNSSCQEPIVETTDRKNNINNWITDTNISTNYQRQLITINNGKQN
jgi:hypothetical protein